MKTHTRSLGAWLLCATLLIPAFPVVQAAVPQVITYQGRLQVNGVNHTGTGQFKFALVDAGTETSVQATATATVVSGFITGITVDDPGAGYTGVPAVTITDTTGSGAVAVATVAGGIITGITVNNAGSGYSATPVVAIDPPPSNLDFVTYWSNDGTSLAGGEPAGAVEVAVTDSFFTVALGDTALANMSAIPAPVFDNDDVHLRIWFDDGVNGSAQLTGDQRLTATGYALRADRSDVAGGVDWADIAGVPAGFGDLVDDVNDADASASNEIQSLGLSGNTLSLSLGGGAVSLSSFVSPWNNSGANLYFNTGKVGIGDNSPQSTLTVGNGDKFQVSGTDGDVYLRDDQASIRFGNSSGANAPMIQMFSSGTSNDDRMVIAHSPNFSTWGLRYEDTSDVFHFIGDNEPIMTIQLSSNQRIGIGTFTPESRLHVIENSSTGTGQLKLTETQYDYSRITFDNNARPSFWDLAARSDTNLANAYFNVYHSDGGNILSVNARGRVGINDTSPSYPLDVRGEGATRVINVRNTLPTTTSSTFNYGVIANLTQAAHTGFPRLFNLYGFSTDSDSYLSYGVYGLASNASNQSYGVYGVASTADGFAVYASGNTFSTGSYLPSDRKLKSNIRSMDNGLGRVMALRPVTADYRTDEYGSMNLPPGEQFGFVADEVDAVMPGLVKASFQPYDEPQSDTAEGQGVEFDAVNYTAMIPVLVSAIQDQQAMIDELRTEIELLKARK